MEWSAKIGPATAQLVEHILSSNHHPEQGYRSCRGIIRLGDKVTVQVAKVDSFKKQVDFRLTESVRSLPRSALPVHGRTQASAGARGKGRGR